MKNIFSDSETIVLRPSFFYFLLKNYLHLLIAALLLAFANHVWAIPYIGYLPPWAASISAFFAVAVLAVAFYRYVDVLLFTKWEITQEQLKVHRGLFVKTVNYIELYRIFDYEQKQNLIESLFGISTVYIHSGDKTHPTLPLFGIKNGSSVVDAVRGRVETMKKIKSIYEITNR